MSIDISAVIIGVGLLIGYHFIFNRNDLKCSPSLERELNIVKSQHNNQIAELKREYANKIKQLQDQVDWLLNELTKYKAERPVILEKNAIKVLLACGGTQRFCSTDSRVLRRANINFYTIENATPELIGKEVRRGLQDNTNYTAIHIAAHGNESGIQMNNALISPEELEPCLGGVNIVILSACKSHTVADKLVTADRSVITMFDNVADENAEEFMYIFWRSIAQGDTIEQAFEHARATTQIKDRVGLRQYKG